MIYDIQSNSVDYNSRVTGIQIWYQNYPKVFFNSVYLNGTGSNKFGSAALWIDLACTNLDLRNNVLVNRRNDSPYCASAVFAFSNPNTTDYNNLYFEPNQYNCLIRIGNLNYYSLTEWQTINKDLNSVSIMPCFCSPDLHIDCTVATCLESRGTPISGIDNDIDGDNRNIFTPDIGADEFDGVSAVEDEAGSIPTKFILEQNYPNPFNPSTTINWQAPVEGHQTIKVFDVLGNEIAVLVDEFIQAGEHKVELSAANLPSGVYFYQLKSENYVSTKKMTVVK
jgi:hypothetical protein